MRMTISAILAVAIAVSPLLAGQQPEPDKEKQKKEEPKKQSTPNPSQEPQGEEKPKPKPEKPKQEPPPPPKEQKQDEKKQRKTAEQNNQKQSAQNRHGRGQKIPEEKFHANFGQDHRFRVTRRDDQRFQHGGYWFEVVDGWPAGWSYEDDCYIEEDGDDYYLVDFIHPEFRILVIVVG
jgi:DNA mismatch repair ATPase MutL